MVNNLMQTVGLALVVAFSWFVWPPLPLLVAGVLLTVGAEARRAGERRREATEKGHPPRKPLPERLLRAWLTARGDAG